MKEMGRKEDLLDRLARRAGCGYLSDLRGAGRSSPYWLGLIRGLQETVPEEYSASDWEDAYSYLTGEHAQFLSAQEGKERLLRQLK